MKSVSQLEFTQDICSTDSAFNLISNNFLNNYKSSFDRDGKLIQSFFLMNDIYFHHIRDSICYPRDFILEKRRETERSSLELIKIDSLNPNFVLVESKLFRNGKLTSTISHIRTDSTIQYISFYKDSTISNVSIVKLNSTGQKQEQITYYGKRIIYHIKYEYNSKGYVSQKLMLAENEIKTTIQYIYTYDKKENWISRSSFENGVKSDYTIRLIDYY